MLKAFAQIYNLLFSCESSNANVTFFLNDLTNSIIYASIVRWWLSGDVEREERRERSGTSDRHARCACTRAANHAAAPRPLLNYSYTTPISVKLKLQSMKHDRAKDITTQIKSIIGLLQTVLRGVGARAPQAHNAISIVPSEHQAHCTAG